MAKSFDTFMHENEITIQLFHASTFKDEYYAVESKTFRCTHVCRIKIARDKKIIIIHK